MKERIELNPQTQSSLPNGLSMGVYKVLKSILLGHGSIWNSSRARWISNRVRSTAERCGSNDGAMKTKDRLRRDRGGYQESVPVDEFPDTIPELGKERLYVLYVFIRGAARMLKKRGSKFPARYGIVEMHMAGMKCR